MKTTTIITIVPAAVVLVLAGCTAGGSTDAGGPDARTGEGATSYPFTMHNCGSDMTFEAAPRRVVTASQAAAEILIHLGVGDRIVGTGYEIDQVPADVAGQNEKNPLLSAPRAENKQEKLLEAQPDFVYTTFGDFLTAGRTGDRAQLHELGVPSYVSEFDCVMHQSVAGANFEMMYQEFRDLARILDVPSAGERFVAEQKAVVDKALGNIENKDTPLKVMWFYSTYGGTPWAAGPGGLPQYISDLVGVENIFDDASSRWPEVSWDEVAARDPDVIILADLTRGEPNDTAREKIDLLKEDPLTSKLDAVAGNRFITVPGRYMDVSCCTANAVPVLVDGLNEFR